MRLPENPLKAIFAIVRAQKEPELHYSFLGTGFFIDNSGLFFTAKHVCKSMENECNAVMIGSSADKKHITSYQISSLRYSEEFDIALGEVKGVQGIHALSIATKNAPMNSDVLTAEFSGTYSKQLEDGEKAIVLRVYFRKGQVLSYYRSTWPETVDTACLELSFPALKGASGAPIIVEHTGYILFYWTI